jgi:hypothetical protein
MYICAPVHECVCVFVCVCVCVCVCVVCVCVCVCMCVCVCVRERVCVPMHARAPQVLRYIIPVSPAAATVCVCSKLGTKLVGLSMRIAAAAYAVPAAACCAGWHAMPAAACCASCCMRWQLPHAVPAAACCMQHAVELAPHAAAKAVANSCMRQRPPHATCSMQHAAADRMQLPCGASCYMRERQAVDADACSSMRRRMLLTHAAACVSGLCCRHCVCVL